VHHTGNLLVVANGIFQKFIYDMHQNKYDILIRQMQQSRFQINFFEKTGLRGFCVNFFNVSTNTTCFTAYLYQINLIYIINRKLSSPFKNSILINNIILKINAFV